MARTLRVPLSGLLVVLGACGSPLPSDRSQPAGSGGVTGSGGTLDAADAAAATGGAGGTRTVITLPSNGGATTVDGDRIPRFDPAVLRPIDGGAAIDADDEPSAGIVIFDRSGSMASTWTSNLGDDPDAAVTETKWVAASRALINALVPVQDRVTIGAVLFPSDGNCGVAPLGDDLQFSFMSGRQFVDAYIARSPDEQPDGNTPLTVAFQVVDQAIETAQSQGLLERRFFVMLLTDGEPNCGSDMTKALALASSWLAQGIKTYVFGLPGSASAHMVLDSVAQAGGTQALVVPGSPSELEGGMAAVF